MQRAEIYRFAFTYRFSFLGGGLANARA